jgi:hypothetical protein
MTALLRKQEPGRSNYAQTPENAMRRFVKQLEEGRCVAQESRPNVL